MPPVATVEQAEQAELVEPAEPAGPVVPAERAATQECLVNPAAAAAAA
jgi:hypothetical protein